LVKVEIYLPIKIAVKR